MISLFLSCSLFRSH
uniref:Uncharacterized protein n=1 Tax=Rhizophora mucronata TaxID=61149 RepID=A0A2P2NV19_RHIMU